MGKRRIWVAAAMAIIGLTALYKGRLQPWMCRWGATDDEVTAELRKLGEVPRVRLGERERAQLAARYLGS